jgi:selenocysteine lyase/cysteine desulfurase
LIVDGALSFGTIEVDLQAMDCDYYGTSLHKGLHAPLGTGFLYVKRERIASLLPLFGAPKPRGEDIRKFEAIGTHPMYQIAAVNQALDFHEAIGVARIRAMLHYLKRNWAGHLARLPNVSFHTALEPGQCAPSPMSRSPGSIRASCISICSTGIASEHGRSGERIFRGCGSRPSSIHSRANWIAS